MTELLCHADSTLKEFDAEVTGTVPEESAVVLDRTAFFPGGGGQPCDLGVLRVPSGDAPADDCSAARTLAVTKVFRKEGEILHRVEGELPDIGDAVHGELDWERRYRLMRTHTAFHILCGVVWRDYRAQVTGASMDELKGRMDFEFETLRHELVEEIEAKLNREVREARPVGAGRGHGDHGFPWSAPRSGEHGTPRRFGCRRRLRRRHADRLHRSGRPDLRARAP